MQAWRNAADAPGQGRLAYLAEALGTSTSRLYKEQAFARAYTAREAEKLDESGYNWGMVEVALRLPDKTERERFLQKAVDEAWNLTDLLFAIQKKHKPRNPGGRPVRVPPTPELALQQLGKLSRRWLKFHQQVVAGGDDALVAAVAALPPDKMSAAFIRLMQETAEAVRELKTAAGEVEQALETAARRAGRGRRL